MTKKNTKTKRRNGGNRSLTWSRVLKDPFNTTACHIPDDQTMDSGCVSSKMFLQFSPYTINGSPAGTHNGGLLLLPHPQLAYYSLYETSGGSGLLSDLNDAGTGYNGSNGAVSNISSISPGGARVRCTSIGLRVTYEGTELSRGGRYYAGLCPIQYAAMTTATTGTSLSPLSTICGSVTPAIASMKMCMTNMVTARVSDGTFSANWFPNGVPTYQYRASSGGESLPGTTSAGVSPVVGSAFNAPYGTAGVQTGQNALVFFVENDYTATLQLSGNTYMVELIYHWEVIPASPASVAYDLTPSRSNYSELSSSLNSFRQMGGVSHEAQVTNTGKVQNITVVAPQPQRGVVQTVSDTWNSLPKGVRKMIVSGGGAALKRVVPLLTDRERRMIAMR